MGVTVRTWWPWVWYGSRYFPPFCTQTLSPGRWFAVSVADGSCSQGR